MRALELEPQHFYKVLPMPAAEHSHIPYFEEFPQDQYYKATGRPARAVPNGGEDLLMNLRYAPVSEHGDDYFKDHRHSLSHR